MSCCGSFLHGLCARGQLDVARQGSRWTFFFGEMTAECNTLPRTALQNIANTNSVNGHAVMLSCCHARGDRSSQGCWVSILGCGSKPTLDSTCFPCLEDLEVFDLASELNRVSPSGKKAFAAGSRCHLYHFVSWTLEDTLPVGAPPWNQSAMNMSLRFPFFSSH